MDEDVSNLTANNKADNHGSDVASVNPSFDSSMKVNKHKSKGYNSFRQSPHGG